MQVPETSYSSEGGGFLDLLQQARHLVQGRSDIHQQVADVLARVRKLERLTDEKLGLKLEGLEMLDVGAGQLLLQMRYFAARNRVVGIDRDLIVQGFDPRGYLEMARTNGARRAAKTIGRKALVIDSRYRRELDHQLGADTPSRLDVRRMDASDMSFPDASFDFVYSFAVFQHLAAPDRVLDEMVRVLRPGGTLYFDFILFTSRTGSHDIRHLSGSDESIPLWAHLQPEHEDVVRPNAYLNGIRLPEWRQMLGQRMDGYDLVLDQPETAWLEPEARALQSRGKLVEYSLEELLTSKVAVLWRRPPLHRASARAASSF
jgi:SAM-dependent methyltransferase